MLGALCRRLHELISGILEITEPRLALRPAGPELPPVGDKERFTRRNGLRRHDEYAQNRGRFIGRRLRIISSNLAEVAVRLELRLLVVSLRRAARAATFY